MMTLPALLFGIIVALAVGALFHFWKNGGLFRMLLHWALALLGFWGGHLLGNSLNVNLLIIGPLQLGMGLLACLIALFIGNWLLSIEPQND